MNSKKYFLLSLITSLIFLLSCEKEWVVIEEKSEDVIIIDTVYIDHKLTINDTIKNSNSSYSFTTSKTEDAVDDTYISELFFIDLRHRPNGRREYLNVFAWTNNSVGESSFDARSIIRFNELSLLNESTVIDSAFITLFVVPPTTVSIHGPTGNNNVRMHLVNESWEEYGVSWVTLPNFSEDVYVETDIITSADNSLRENITQMVQQMITIGNYGLLLKNANENAPLSAVRFFSSEYSEPDKRPYLTIYYHEE